MNGARTVGFAMAILLLSQAGCGPKLAKVEGRVLSRGEPLPAGSKIVFGNPETGIIIEAKLDSSGDFRVEMAEGYGLPPGSYGVAVLPPRLGKASPEVLEKFRKLIPLRYRKAETSALRLELPPGGTTFNVDLTDE